MEKTNKTCMDCAFFDICEEGKKVCHCNKHNIDITIIKENDEECILDREICEDFKEATYHISEFGVFCLVLAKMDIDNDIMGSTKMKDTWTIFMENMKKYGFYKEGDEDKEKEYPKTDLSVEDIFKKAIRVMYKIGDEDILDAAWMLFKHEMEGQQYW